MIGWVVETYLKYYRHSERSVLLKVHSSRFEREEYHIISLLKQSELYRGTGAYHYRYDSGSKYDGGVSSVSHTLPHILRSGLVPQKDLFNTVFQTGVSHSLSLTKNRLYARGYASVYHGQPVCCNMIMALVYSGYCRLYGEYGSVGVLAGCNSFFCCHGQSEKK